MSLNYNIGQTGPQSRGRSEGEAERKTSAQMVFLAGSAGPGRASLRERILPGLPEAQRLGKSEGSPLPQHTLLGLLKAFG